MIDFELPRADVYGGIGRRGSEVLLVERPNGRLSFLKGHMEAEDAKSEEAAALREIREESGYVAQIVKQLGVFDRVSMEAGITTVQKYYHMFLVQLVAYDPPLLRDENTVWVAPDAAVTRMYPQDAAFLASHQATILGGPDSLIA